MVNQSMLQSLRSVSTNCLELSGIEVSYIKLDDITIHSLVIYVFYNGRS